MPTAARAAQPRERPGEVEGLGSVPHAYYAREAAADRRRAAPAPGAPRPGRAPGERAPAAGRGRARCARAPEWERLFVLYPRYARIEDALRAHDRGLRRAAARQRARRAAVARHRHARHARAASGPLTARRRRRAERRRRRRDGGLPPARQPVRAHPPARPSHRARPGDGLLPASTTSSIAARYAQAHVRDRARRGPRLGRPPRQRDAGDPLGGPVGALRRRCTSGRSIPAPAGSTRSAGATVPGRRSTSRCRRARATREYLEALDRVVLPAIEAFRPAACCWSPPGRTATPPTRSRTSWLSLAGFRAMAERAAALARRLGDRPRPGPRGRLQRHDAAVDRPRDRRGARRLRRPAGGHLRARRRIRARRVAAAAARRARRPARRTIPSSPDRAARALLARDAGGRGARRGGAGGSATTVRGGGRRLQRARSRRACATSRFDVVVPVGLPRRAARRAGRAAGARSAPALPLARIAPWAREAPHDPGLPLVAAVRLRHDGLSLHRRAGRRPRVGRCCSRRRPGVRVGMLDEVREVVGAALLAAAPQPQRRERRGARGRARPAARASVRASRASTPTTSSGRSCAGRSQPIRPGAGLLRLPSAHTTACATCCRGRARTCG